MIKRMKEELEWTRSDTEKTLWLIPFALVLAVIIGAWLS